METNISRLTYEMIWQRPKRDLNTHLKTLGFLGGDGSLRRLHRGGGNGAKPFKMSKSSWDREEHARQREHHRHGSVVEDGGSRNTEQLGLAEHLLAGELVSPEAEKMKRSLVSSSQRLWGTIKKSLREFPGGPVVDSPLAMQGMQVRTLVGELRSHM